MDKKCFKCKRKFCSFVYINGKRKNLQNRKYCLDCSPFGCHNTTKLEKYETTKNEEHFICKICKQEKLKKDKRRGYTCQECWLKSEANKKLNQSREYKKILVKIKGGKCEKCVYDQNISALEFHHMSDKDFIISSGSRNKLTEKIINELRKCKLLCCNCHKKEHEKKTPLYLKPTENPNFLNIKNLNNSRKNSFTCTMCLMDIQNENFITKKQICKSCHSCRVTISRRKNKKEYVNYLGGKCIQCDYIDLCGLEFHHVDPVNKKFAIAEKKFVKMNSEIKSELDKCQLLCSNCHRETENPTLYIGSCGVEPHVPAYKAGPQNRRGHSRAN